MAKFDTSNSLVRGAAMGILLDVFGAEFGDLTLEEGSWAIDGLIWLANDRGLDLYEAAQAWQRTLAILPAADRTLRGYVRRTAATR